MGDALMMAIKAARRNGTRIISAARIPATITINEAMVTRIWDVFIVKRLLCRADEFVKKKICPNENYISLYLIFSSYAIRRLHIVFIEIFIKIGVLLV